MDCYDYGLGNSFENNAWNLEHNEEILQEILNRISYAKNCEYNYLCPSSHIHISYIYAECMHVHNYVAKQK